MSEISIPGQLKAAVNDSLTYAEDPDVVLMLAFKAGDNSSFEKLMVKYYSKVMNFIYRYLGVKEIAEDITQEVFIRVYKSAGSYSVQAKFQTWLFTIAKNLSLNYIRDNKRFAQSLDAPVEYDGQSLKVQIADDSRVGPDGDIEESEKRDMVRQAILALPENQKTAVLLRRYEDFSYEEIARSMNTTPKAVKALLSRAKGNLRKALAELIEL